MKNKKIAINGIIAAMYVAMTLINPISYGYIQFRISEIMIIYSLINKETRTGCLVGVAIANLFSPLGVIDVVAGVMTGVILYYAIDRIKAGNIIKCLMYSLECGIIIGAELYLVYKIPFVVSFASITVSQAIISLIAIPICNRISKIKA